MLFLILLIFLSTRVSLFSAMCPVERGCSAPGLLTIVPRADVRLGTQVSMPRTGPSLLERRRKLTTPLLVESFSARAADLNPPMEDSQSPGATTLCTATSPLDAFNVLEVLGQGSCAVVRRARHVKDGQEVALKTVRTDDEEIVEITRREYEMLRSIDHPHIVRAFDFFTTMDCAVVVMELYEGEPLDRAVRLSPTRCFAEARARAFFEQLVYALAYLHRRGILHRDVKGQNVLVSTAAKPDLRLVDFNVACSLSDGSLTPTGTPDYLAPEILAGQSASEASDVWAAGLCLLLMLAGSLPRRFDNFVSAGDFEAAIVRRCSRSVEISKPCLAVLRGCLHSDRGLRLAAEALLSEQWLSA